MSAPQFAVCRFICKEVRQAYELKISFEQPEALKSVERYTILRAVDELWQEHLYGMDTLRESIGLRAYGQRDPLIEYKAEAFKVFEELMVNIKTEICHNIFRSASSMMAFDSFIRNVPQSTIHQSSRGLWRRGPPARQTPAPSPTAKIPATWSRRRPKPWPRRARFAAAQSGTERSLPLRQRKEIQALLRQKRVRQGRFQPGRLG